LTYDKLFEAETTTDPKAEQFDVMMVDDPWLAQLVEEGRLEQITNHTLEHQLSGVKLTEFAPEFLSVAYYRKSQPYAADRRPTRDQLKQPKQTHPDLAKLKALSGSGYGLFALPYLGNVQAIVRHTAESKKPDPLGVVDQVTWSTLKEKDPRFLMRMGSNNSAVADFLPILRAEGGCLITNGMEANPDRSALSSNGIAVQALADSVDLVKHGPIQHARFMDDDVQTYVLNMPDSIAISWLAFVGWRPSLEKAPQGNTGEIRWYLMPKAAPNAQRPCADEAAAVEAPGTLGAWLLAVNSHSREQRSAWVFVSMVLQDLAKSAPEGFPTPFEDQLSRKRWIQSAVHNSVPRPSHPRWHDIENAVGIRIRQAHWGTLDPAEAIKRADLDVDQILLEQSRAK
jgi:hypothetical protein